MQCGPGTSCDLSVGTYNFTAKYSGDASFNPATTTIPFTINPGILYWQVWLNNQTPYRPDKPSLPVSTSTTTQLPSPPEPLL